MAHLTRRQAEEVIRCTLSVQYFVSHWLWRKDAKLGKAPFKPYDWQNDLLFLMQNGRSFILVKSRQIGASWICAAYALWLITFHPYKEVYFMSQNEEKAIKLLNKAKFLVDTARHHETGEDGSFLFGSVGDWTKRRISFLMDVGDAVPAESYISSITTTTDSARGDTANFILLDEFAALPNDVETWASVKPATSRGGHWAGISCVTKDALILTSDGVVEIGKYCAEQVGFSDIAPIRVLGRDGMRRCDTSYTTRETETVKLTTKFGYQLECTGNHPILVNRQGVIDWVEAQDVECGDWVPLVRGAQCFGSSVSIIDCMPDLDSGGWGKNRHWQPEPDLDEDLAYLIGLIIGDGYVYKNGYNKSVTIASTDAQTGKFLTGGCGSVGLFFRKQKDGCHYIATSKAFVQFLRRFGLDIDALARDKTIPDRIMGAPKHIVSACLSGLFDADGCAKKNGDVSFTTTSCRLARQIHILLLNFGIVGSLRYQISSPSKRVRAYSEQWVLDIYRELPLFYDEIGFRLDRKQSRRASADARDCGRRDVIPYAAGLIERIRRSHPNRKYDENTSRKRWSLCHNIKNKAGKTADGAVSYLSCRMALEYFPQPRDRVAYDELSWLVDKDYLWVKVISKYDGFAKTYDLHIPDGHSFVSNGFISHNTPRGIGNEFHRLFLLGESKATTAWDVKKVHWRDCPDLDDAWFAEQSASMTATQIAQEFDLQFTVTGDPAFDPTDLAACLKLVDEVVGVQELMDRSKKFWIGVDTAEGGDQNVFLALNEFGIQVHTVANRESIGKWAGVQEEGTDGLYLRRGTVAKELAKLNERSRDFGACFIERNNQGIAVYQMLIPTEYDKIPIEVLFTSVKTKPQLITDLALAIEGHQITVTDYQTYAELSMYQKLGRGKYGPPTGYNDDHVIGLALAHHAAKINGYEQVEWNWQQTAGSRRIVQGSPAEDAKLDDVLRSQGQLGRKIMERGPWRDRKDGNLSPPWMRQRLTRG